MALQKTITFPALGQEIEVQNTYIKANFVSGTKNLQTVEVHFINNGETIDIRKYQFTPNLDGQNFIQQAYEHLKTLPEFAGATDV